jgi:translocation and assembly module TamA
MSMVQISGRVKTILPIADQDRLIMRAEIGTTATSDFDQLPASYRYFAGGDQSVRGFDYKNLSPLNDEGDSIGGKHLAVASVEYEHRLYDSYALAVFVDGGNAFTNDFKMAGSVGIGFRWFSPIGPLRVDLGVPVTEADHDFRIHLSLGPDL